MWAASAGGGQVVVTAPSAREGRSSDELGRVGDPAVVVTAELDASTAPRLAELMADTAPSGTPHVRPARHVVPLPGEQEIGRTLLDTSTARYSS